MSKIAFLGLGAMGSRMAARLFEAGHEVTVWNRTADRAAPMVDAGAKQAVTPRDAAADAQAVIAMVRDDEASQAVWLDAEAGAARSMAPGALAIECSTLTVDWTRRLGGHLAEKDIRFLDAPLAGSRPQAESGQLIFLAGGATETLEEARPLLLAMGAAVHHGGEPVGSGMALKLMVNAFFGLQVAALAELLAMGEKLGVPQVRGAAILAETPVMSLAAKGAAGAMAERAFQPLFPIDLVEKDFGYVAATAEAAGADVPLARAAHERFAQAKAAGYGSDNVTGIAQLY